MIRADSIKASYPLAEQMAQTAFTVLAKPNTPLEELNRIAGGEVFQAVVSEETKLDDFAGFVEDVTKAHGEGLDVIDTQHDVALEGFVEIIGKAVASHVSYARSVVKPLVIDYAEKVKEQLVNYEAPDAGSQFTIDVMELPVMLQDVSFFSSLNKYTNASVLMPDRLGNLPAQTDDELLAMMLTGDSDLDQGIAEWHSKKGPAFFADVWAGFFSSKAAGVNKPITPTVFGSMDVFSRADVAMAIFLLARKLYESPIDGDDSMSLSAWREMTVQLRDFGGAAVMESVRIVTAFDNVKRLVVSIDPETLSCKVNGRIYRPWLKDGGKQEVLFGLVVAERSESTVQAIDELTEEMLRKWNSYVAFYRTSQVNQRFDIFKKILKIQFGILMESITEGEQEFISNSSDYMGKVDKYFNEELDKLSMLDMEDIYTTALALVCRSRFYYTDAELILTYINEYSKANPNIDVREAALMAVITYVADYVADQMVKVAI